MTGALEARPESGFWAALARRPYLERLPRATRKRDFPAGLLDGLRGPAEARRALQFACVGLLGVGVNSALLWLLTERVQLFYLMSSALATEGAILSNFTLNHAWTFASLRDGEPVLPKLAKFNVVSLGGLLLTVTTLFALTHFLGLHYLVANVMAVGSGATWNYAVNRRWTWARVPQASQGT